MKGLHFISTEYLKEIIDHPHHLGKTGRDYAPVISEIKDIYFDRLEREAQLREREMIKEIHQRDVSTRYEYMHREVEDIINSQEIAIRFKDLERVHKILTKGKKK